MTAARHPGPPASPARRTGARSLLRALVELGVDTCWANPGTSEMHLVAALDDVPEMRAVLTLFEGVATGAADGYGRMRDRPAATLLHLGPGLANGLANLHNARRAHTPVVNVVGDHATYHHRYDAPLDSDLAALAGAVSGWYREASRSGDVAADAADAVAASLGPPGQVATLAVPADVSWGSVSEGGEGTSCAGELAPPRAFPTTVGAQRVAEAAEALGSEEPSALLLGGTALRQFPLKLAGRLSRHSGARLLAETFPARLERGAGRTPVERLAYLPELAAAQLAGLRHLVLVGATEPVSFFAYPGQASRLTPPDCQLTTLCRPGDDPVSALEAVAERCQATSVPATVSPEGRPEAPTGELTMDTLARAVGCSLPVEAVVVDEGNTAGIAVPGATAGCPPHDWLCLTGGAIGQGMPLATGAALASPGRQVLNLQADGSAMYTLQALWTQARESLDVTTVVLANHAYAILSLELSRMGAGQAGPRARRLLDLRHPELDMVALAQGMGVPARRVEGAEALVESLARSFSEPGPSLIEVPLPTSLG